MGGWRADRPASLQERPDDDVQHLSRSCPVPVLRHSEVVTRRAQSGRGVRVREPTNGCVAVIDAVTLRRIRRGSSVGRSAGLQNQMSRVRVPSPPRSVERRSADTRVSEAVRETFGAVGRVEVRLAKRPSVGASARFSLDGIASDSCLAPGIVRGHELLAHDEKPDSPTPTFQALPRRRTGSSTRRPRR